MVRPSWRVCNVSGYIGKNIWLFDEKSGERGSEVMTFIS